MGYSIGYDKTHGRDIGYGVPSQCDQPECFVEIYRGLSYVCGGDVYGGEHGCGLFFCETHLLQTIAPEEAHLPFRCERCHDGVNHFEPSPDLPVWVKHQLTDPSWHEWRVENPNFVKQNSTLWLRIQAAIAHLKSKKKAG